MMDHCTLLLGSTTIIPFITLGFSTWGAGAGGPPAGQGKPEGGYSPPLVRITLASLDECHNLLQNGLDFYGATFFPTEPGPNNALLKVINKKAPHYLSGRLWESGGRVRDLLPVFDSSGFAKIPPPPTKTVKPRP